VLSQSASSILDLYQAVYPIKHAKALEEPKNALLFSNSCLYMAGAIQRIEDTLYGQANLKERLAECRHNLQVSSDSLFDETIVSVDVMCVTLLSTDEYKERQRTTINEILDAAKGFTYTSDQDRYDECESAVNSVLQKIKRLAQQLKVRIHGVLFPMRPTD
jgi:centromere/kinetochore protein ZW10